jgi:TerC family integral membrane protein
MGRSCTLLLLLLLSLFSRRVRVFAAEVRPFRTLHQSLPLRVRGGGQAASNTREVAEVRSVSTRVRGGGQGRATSSAMEIAEFRSALARVSSAFLLAWAFGVAVWIAKGRELALEFFAAYIVEQSLSIDNLFVFVVLFDYFKVPVALQRKALQWGILGAVFFRFFMITIGVAALKRFRPVSILFATALISSAWRIFNESNPSPERAGDDMSEDNELVRLAKFLCPTVATNKYDGDKFFTRRKGLTRATPLFVCVLCIELSDLVFAVNSIPAALSISQSNVIVFSSNVFAVMALRSLYTVVAYWCASFAYLRPAVAVILGFVGLKLILEYMHIGIGIGFSFIFISACLACGIALSLLSSSTY